jgi:hypothetical protein
MLSDAKSHRGKYKKESEARRQQEKRRQVGRTKQDQGGNTLQSKHNGGKDRVPRGERKILTNEDGEAKPPSTTAARKRKQQATQLTSRSMRCAKRAHRCAGQGELGSRKLKRFAVDSATCYPSPFSETGFTGQILC